MNDRETPEPPETAGPEQPTDEIAEAAGAGTEAGTSGEGRRPVATEAGEAAESRAYREPQVPEAPADPGTAPEEEGIPDLQDGTPEAQRAEDPQQMPVPGERPVAAEDFGTTFAEQVEGAPLDERLAEEEPDVGDEAAEGEPAPEAGQLSDDPLPGTRPANQDSFSTASEAEGLAGEETAVHVSGDDDEDLGLRLDEEEPGAPPT
ncbi:hypothetical protein [Streptomyces sp. JJ36]|uniref:hypothetical protein n=1 Tax=Streptomyces sp. JJ36 TaxID=2736645 RepID=UPI001F2D7441|nr:hypothetical protein [Streptomyces sp. JJ36]MCF6525364.1 hypothetical protein [Streptomyces sp. JJ36]